MCLLKLGIALQDRATGAIDHILPAEAAWMIGAE
jgi:hypothetical protein